MKLGMGVVPDCRWPRYVLKQPMGGPRILLATPMLLLEMIWLEHGFTPNSFISPHPWGPDTCVCVWGGSDQKGLGGDRVTK